MTSFIRSNVHTRFQAEEGIAQLTRAKCVEIVLALKGVVSAAQHDQALMCTYILAHIWEQKSVFPFVIVFLTLLHTCDRLLVLDCCVVLASQPSTFQRAHTTG